MTTGMNRRQALELLASIPFASVFTLTGAEVARAQEAVRSGFTPKFLTDHEHRTVRVLVDTILPKDDRSGSATEAGVPEFMDFMMIDQPERQAAMRGGLAWMDLECRERFGEAFVDCRAEERAALLDLLAWPDRAPKELSHGVAFFNGFRDLTATGFFTSKMGFEDLAYMGNEFVTEWKGCPQEAIRKLGL
ncbi:MAG TPA: gluconate 2-dehydrogenase subunit 3 family protein [Vicinamibacteria bacterium]